MMVFPLITIENCPKKYPIDEMGDQIDMLRKATLELNIMAFDWLNGLVEGMNIRKRANELGQLVEKVFPEEAGFKAANPIFNAVDSATFVGFSIRNVSSLNKEVFESHAAVTGIIYAARASIAHKLKGGPKNPDQDNQALIDELHAEFYSNWWDIFRQMVKNKWNNFLTTGMF